MNFNEYQQKALETDYSRECDTVSVDFFATILGLPGEAGEICEKFKKIYWHKKGKWDEEDKKALVKELGDVLWYISSLSSHIGVKLEDVAKSNIEKLKSRVERGVHLGNGDNR